MAGTVVLLIFGAILLFGILTPPIVMIRARSRPCLLKLQPGKPGLQRRLCSLVSVTGNPLGTGGREGLLCLDNGRLVLVMRDHVALDCPVSAVNMLFTGGGMNFDQMKLRILDSAGRPHVWRFRLLDQKGELPRNHALYAAWAAFAAGQLLRADSQERLAHLADGAHELAPHAEGATAGALDAASVGLMMWSIHRREKPMRAWRNAIAWAQRSFPPVRGAQLDMPAPSSALSAAD